MAIGSTVWAGEQPSTRVLLATVGSGEAIHTRYGHTFLRLDGERLVSGAVAGVVYDWGRFDASDPLLPLNFFRGRLRYRVGSDMSFRAVLRYYSRVERRRVTEHELALTPAESEALQRLVVERSRGRHQTFWYHHFRRNCATFPRDLIDQATGGELRRLTERRFSQWRLRDYVRWNLGYPEPVGWFLDLMLNSEVDGPLSLWDEMFYPRMLEQTLSTTVRSSGQPFLASEPKVWIDLPEQLPPPRPLHGYIGGGMLLVAGAAALLERRGCRRLAQACLAIPLGVATALGMIMALSWGFSEHRDLHHNANLFFFCPFDVLGLLWRNRRHRHWRTLQQRYAGLRQIMIAGGWVAVWSGCWSQDCSQALWLTPALVWCFAVIGWAGWRRSGCADAENRVSSRLSC